MSNQRYQGEIIRWKEDKGFGFIKTPSIEKDIFLHISAIKNRQRQPNVGDTIYFDLKFEEQGKLKAINASFTPEISQPKQTIKPSTPSTQRKQNFPNKQPTNNFYHRETAKPSTIIRRQQKNLQNPRINQRSNARQSMKSSNLRNVVLFIVLIVGGLVSLPSLFPSKTQTSVPVPNTPVTPVNNSPSPSVPNTPVSPVNSSPSPSQVQQIPAPQQACKIKGNISYSSGEKLYYKPSYHNYLEVEIFTNEGEKWFCSEQEAINAGFQDAAKYAQ